MEKLSSNDSRKVARRNIRINFKKGVKEFYSGSIADDIIKSLNDLGGLHTIEDFQKQNTIRSETISADYRNISVHQCPPSGPGITVLVMMKLLEKLSIEKYNVNSVERFHLEAEVTKQAYKLKEETIGDPDFVNLDLKKYYEDNIDNIYKNISVNSCVDVGI